MGRIRSTSDIRTAGSRVAPNSTAHKLIMKIAALEMKRQRFQRERTAADERIRHCEDRCQQITNEVQSLVAEIQRRYPEVPLPTIGANGARTTIPPKTSSSISSSSLTHRY